MNDDIRNQNLVMFEESGSFCAAALVQMSVNVLNKYFSLTACVHSSVFGKNTLNCAHLIGFQRGRSRCDPRAQVRTGFAIVFGQSCGTKEKRIHFQTSHVAFCELHSKL